MTDLLQRIALAADATRSAQKDYFRDRTNENLRRSKALEAQLDKMLAEHAAEAAGVKQGQIFEAPAPPKDERCNCGRTLTCRHDVNPDQYRIYCSTCQLYGPYRVTELEALNGFRERFPGEDDRELEAVK